MPLETGTRLGPYEITGAIGAGGMGEVYRARDTRLNRDAAIKVLPAAFATDAEGVARFRREAQVLASLHHPNIASIYGLEDTAGSEGAGQGALALALEFVEGEDLAQRLSRGPIGVDEAVGLARQIIDGLEAAHEKGIIHRDLKPANIKVTSDGVVKILDFGLAKLVERDGSGSGASVSTSFATMTSPAMTEKGVILGTAAYMSPEQARGKPVDKRADIWAFGVVLFEMLTGRKLLAGETMSDTLAAVLTREVDWTMLPASTPPGVRRLLVRCLDRDAKKRLRDIGDARIYLDDAFQIVPAGQTTPAAGAIGRLVPWAVAAGAIVLAAWAIWGRAAGEPVSGAPMHLDVGFPPDVEPLSQLSGGFGVAPDGKTVSLIGVRDGVRRLYIRRLDRTEATEIGDTGGVNAAVFSPDGSSVAFIPGSANVTRLSLVDHQRTVVATGADLGSGLTWSTAGIIFTRGGSLWIVAPEGGTARALTTLDTARHEVMHADALVPPGGRRVLFTSLADDNGTERIDSVDLDGSARTVVIEHASMPVWSSTGHLLFARDGAVLAVPFDPVGGTVRGTAIPVLPTGVVGTVRNGSLGIYLSASGTLIYTPPNLETKRVISVGRDGSELALGLPMGRYANPRISPDGRRLLLEVDGSAMETLDLARGTRAKVTAAAIGTNFGTWSADGERIVFRRFNIPFWAAANGSGRLGPVPSSSVNDYPSGPGPDPDSYVMVRIQPESSGDVFLMSITGAFAPKPLVVTPAYEGGPQLSPDGHWLLYQSNGSGSAEIFVRRYPALDREWQVSEGGGVQTRWGSNSREIFYRSGHNMMAVTLDASGAEPVFSKPTALFADEYDFGAGITIANYDVTREGRFIMLRRGPQGGRLHAVINWTEELKQILAAGGVR